MRENIARLRPNETTATSKDVVSTKFYDKFNYLEHNREIDKLHVRRLVASIKLKNLLEYKPILIDSNFNVLDGQHRLEAAKELGVAIYYQVNNKLTDEDIITIQNQKPWQIADYFNYYIRKDYLHYVNLKKFMEKNGIRLNQAILYAKDYHDRTWDKFRDGTFELVAEEVAQEKFDQIKKTISIIKDINVSGTTVWLYSQALSKALYNLFENADFDYATFLKKIPYKINAIHPCGRYRDYYRMFVDVYNFRNSNPIEIK